MAFVYRSSKNLEEHKKFVNSLPLLNNLEYEILPEITKKYFSKNNINKSSAPFGVKASKESPINKFNSNSPGPGSYQIQENFLKKSFNQNLTSPFDPENIEGTPAQLFISKERRFKYNNKIDNDNPSPAEYFQEKNKFSKNYEKKPNPRYFKHFNVFDPGRKISIPSDDFYFDIKPNGEVEVKQDINEIKNKENNTGPGSYDVKYNTKNNNSIDWSRTADNIKKNKNKANEKIIEDIDKLKINTQVNTFNKFEESLNNTSNNKINTSTNALLYNIEKITNKMCNTEITNKEESTKKDRFETKTESFPGPGDYEISPYINVPICFSNVTNFGSNSSRGLLYPTKDNKILIGHKDKKFLAVIKNNDKKRELNKSMNLKNKSNNIEIIKSNKNRNKLKLPYDSYKLNALYINNIKERNLLNKKILMDQIGPGSYDPSTSFYRSKIDNDVQNFGVLEKRFKDNQDKQNIPGVGTYSLQNSFSKKKSMYQSPIPQNITRKNSEGLSNAKFQEMKMQIYEEKNKQPGVWDYFPELVNSMDYKIYKEVRNSEKKPGFNNGEKRFFESKHKYEDENQIGKYNLFYKKKEFGQQKSPFGSGEEKTDIKEGFEKPYNIGPGAYRYDSYFDWNKKSYNMIFNI